MPSYSVDSFSTPFAMLVQCGNSDGGGVGGGRGEAVPRGLGTGIRKSPSPSSMRML